MEQISAEGLELALRLQNDLHRMVSSVSVNLINDLDRDVKLLRAELDMIRFKVGLLLDGKYMPTPAAIVDAMYPSREAVQGWMDGSEQ